MANARDERIIFKAEKIAEADALSISAREYSAPVSAQERDNFPHQGMVTGAGARSEDNAQLEPENSGVLDQSGAVWSNNVLKHRLSIEPLVHLDAIIELEDRFVDLRRPSPFLVRDLFVLAVVAICEGDAYLVLISTRDQSLINQAGVEIEWQWIIILRSEVYQAEEIQSLFT